MTSDAPPLRIESRLGEDVHAIVMRYLTDNPDSRKRVADSLNVPVSSIDVLMTRTYWEPSLALRIAEVLDLQIKAVAVGD